MKKLFYFLTILGIVFTACENGSGVEDENKVTPFVPEISITPTTLNFSCNGGERAVDIIANFEYEVTERASWITIEQTDEGLLVVVDENKNTAERSAFISITNRQYDITKTIDVVQEAWVPKIDIAQQNIEVEFEPAEYEVTVTSPYSWEATTKNDWIEVKTETGIAGEEVLKFSVKRNEEMQERKGTITIKNSNYNLVVELYVTQKAFVPELTVEPESLSFAVEGGTQEIVITANFDYAYTANVDWVALVKGENGIEVSVPNYVEVDERTAKITISSDKYGVSKTVDIAQGAFIPEWNIETESLNFAVEGGTQEVVITANFEYEYIADVDWITFKKTGNGINVTAKKSDMVTERTAEIIISNEKYGLSKVINVSQSAFVPEWNIETESLNFAVEGGTQEVVITANFEYEYTTNVYWVSFRKTGNGINVTAKKSDMVTERTAEIIISNEKYGLSKVINVSQSAFVPEWNIETESLNFEFVGGAQKVVITANFEYEYTANVNWITFDETTNGIEVAAYVNTKEEIRTAEITISSKKYNLSKKISVSQNGLSKEFVISYTSSDGKIVNPPSGWFNDNATTLQTFGANIVSNTYNNGQGIIIFDAPVTSIGEGAFYKCSKLTSVIIPDSVTSIGGNAFYFCESLTKVTIGNSVTSIGNSAFYNCKSLTSVIIPDSVISIGSSAFYCCSLTSVIIPNSVTSIGHAAFYGCDMTSVTIPNSVTSIGGYAFRWCTSLTSVTIPEGVTSIGDYVFGECSNLTSVYCKPMTPPSDGGDHMFFETASDMKIYVPRNSVDAYKSASGWSRYKSHIQPYDFE